MGKKWNVLELVSTKKSSEIVVTVIDSTDDEVPFTKDSSIIYQEEENALTHVHVDIDERVRREKGSEE